MKRLHVLIKEVKPGVLKGQRIAVGTYKVSDGGEGVIEFDVIGDLIKVSPGDEITVEVSEKLPDNLDPYAFCGHGYLVSPEAEKGSTIFSIWGIIFKFKPPIGLEMNKKYYLCIK